MHIYTNSSLRLLEIDDADVWSLETVQVTLNRFLGSTTPTCQAERRLACMNIWPKKSGQLLQNVIS